MAPDPDDETFFKDLALAIVTLGFYMPYWMWRKNQDLVDLMPEARFRNNGWWLSGGAAVAMAARWLFGSPAVFFGSVGRAEQFAAVLFSLLGILVFLYGGYLFTRHVQEAATRLRLRPGDPPWWFPAMMGAAFVGIEFGNLVPSWWLRGPVLVLYFSLPYFFYRVHRDYVRVEEVALRRLAERRRDERAKRPLPPPMEETELPL